MEHVLTIEKNMEGGDQIFHHPLLYTLMKEACTSVLLKRKIQRMYLVGLFECTLL